MPALTGIGRRNPHESAPARPARAALPPMTVSDNTIENSPAARNDDTIALIAGKLIHEIKNPLSAIYMNLQLLDEEWRSEAGPKQERLKKKIALLKDETRRLHDILDDFLRFARSSVIVERRPHDLNEVMSEVIDFVRPEAMSRSIRVLTTYSSPPPVGNIDKNLFKQALLNILLNAQEALDSNGDIIVKTFARGGHAFLDISDTGRGMTEDEQRRMFEPFYSTKGSGSGLGLPATSKIIEAHGGEISVQSRPGSGTNFRIKLPLAPATGPDT